MSKKKSTENFESKLTRLEQITESLENNELGLEKSVSLFEEGVALSKECLQILEKAELKVKTLKKDLDKTSLSLQDSE
jgi:exodeoxyribonuclease VII small subunit